MEEELPLPMWLQANPLTHGGHSNCNQRMDPMSDSLFLSRAEWSGHAAGLPTRKGGQDRWRPSYMHGSPRAKALPTR
eukprot:1137767-Pelagomonas_calceolata.AAC.3